MTTINQEANKLNPDTYIEFYRFDATQIGGSAYYYTNTPTGSTSPILWQANSYVPLPFIVEGYRNSADGTAPARPTLAISNVQKFLMAAMLTHGDLIGTIVTRWRTFYKFTDSGSEPSTTTHFPIDEYTITRKMPSSINTEIKFEMTSPLDRPGLKLPRRQVLRDNGFPGTSRTRVR